MQADFLLAPDHIKHLFSVRPTPKEVVCSGCSSRWGGTWESAWGLGISACGCSLQHSTLDPRGRECPSAGPKDTAAPSPSQRRLSGCYGWQWEMGLASKAVLGKIISGAFHCRSTFSQSHLGKKYFVHPHLKGWELEV